MLMLPLLSLHNAMFRPVPLPMSSLEIPLLAPIREYIVHHLLSMNGSADPERTLAVPTVPYP